MPRVYDPHDDSFIACNLYEDEWRVYKQNQKILELAEKIKEIVSDGLVAVISNSLLTDLSIDVAAEATTPAVIIQSFRNNPHWASIALCMLTHCSMEPDTEVTRFERSVYPQEPMYWDNVEAIYDTPRKFYTTYVRKDKVKVEKQKQLDLMFSESEF